MAIFRVTFEFDGPQLATVGSSATPGWSESWYREGNTIDEVLLAALSTRGNDWMMLRTTALANIYRISRVRVTDVANFRLSKSATPNNIVGQSTSPAQVNCALLVDFTVLPKTLGDTTHHRRSDFRGLSTDVINGNIIRPGAAYTALLRFLNEVGNTQTASLVPGTGASPWLIQYQDPAVHKQPITGLTITGPNSRFITVTNDFGPLAPGTQLRITGVKFPSFMNRIWKVRAVVGVGPQNAPYTLGNSRRQLAGVWDGLGNIQLVSDLYSRADQYSVVGLRSRATGRPPILTRGRRSRG